MFSDTNTVVKFQWLFIRLYSPILKGDYLVEFEVMVKYFKQTKELLASLK